MNGGGLLEVFVLGSDTALWKISQATPDGAFSGWQGLGKRSLETPP